MELTQEIISQCHSVAEVVRKCGRYPNTRTTNSFREQIKTLGLDISHFSKNGSVKKAFVERECPICKILFTPQYRDKQITCSYACSNTYFARKRNNPSKYKNYRTICFHNHDKKCVVCGEDKIVAVHHMDENPKNNDPKNLVPLCPTHHQYWHSRYRDLVRKKIEDYISEL
jgi:hypothetical protein